MESRRNGPQLSSRHDDDDDDVGTTGKLVSSACYDRQQVCVYLQPFSCY